MLILGKHDDNTLEQMRRVAQHAKYTALMSDGHYGFIMPIGGVAAYDNKVSVSGVGFDIACGNCAIRTALPTWVFAQMKPALIDHFADEIQNQISFGVGRTNNAHDAPWDHELFEDDRWDLLPDNVRLSLKEKARDQIGTVGSGNHYVDVFAGSDGFVWVGVHFGSRGLGHTIASGFLALTVGEQWGAKVKEHDAIVDLDTGIGRDYWHLMELCGEYAYAGREWVARKVVTGILGTAEQWMVHNHHNFAWRETHFGENLVVVRKGATPAFPGQYGFVGGSMGDDAVILHGAREDEIDRLCPRDCDFDMTLLQQQQSMFSTVHGAGRVMSRTAAAGKRNRKTGEQLTAGLVSHEDMDAWVSNAGVTLRGAGLDEAPQAYRRLKDVIAAQGSTVVVDVVLRPIIVVMAGANEHDPYKD